MASKAQKKAGYPIPNVIRPQASKSYCITIPDDKGYYDAMLGQLTMLGKWWKWKHDKDPNNPEAVYSAEEWRMILAIEENCGTMPIDCGEIEGCLETSSIISNIQTKASGGYDPSNVTRAVNTGEFSALLDDNIYTPLSSCDDADKDKLWSALNALIDYWHERNLLLLSEFANSAGLQAVINTLIIRVPIYQALNSTIKNAFASWLILQARSAYTSQVTSTILYELKCELFCNAVAAGCAIDLQSAIDTVLAYGLAWTTSGNIVELFTELSGFSGANAKQWFASIASLTAALATLGEESVTSLSLQSFVSAAEAATAQPSNTWKAYCTDCASPIGWIAVFDFTGFYVSADPNEIVYRPPFNFLQAGAQGANSSAEIVLGTGLLLDHPASSGALRRQIDFEPNCNWWQVEIRATGTLGTCKVGIDSNTSGNIEIGFDLPSANPESGILNGGSSYDKLYLQGENRVSTVYWRVTWEWIKFRQNPNSPTPPPKLV